MYRFCWMYLKAVKELQVSQFSTEGKTPPTPTPQKKRYGKWGCARECALDRLMGNTDITQCRSSTSGFSHTSSHERKRFSVHPDQTHRGSGEYKITCDIIFDRFFHYRSLSDFRSGIHYQETKKAKKTRDLESLASKHLSDWNHTDWGSMTSISASCNQRLKHIIAHFKLQSIYVVHLLRLWSLTPVLLFIEESLSFMFY